MKRLLLRLSVLVLALSGLSACSTLPTAQDADAMPIVHDGHLKKGVEKAIVVIPGAMASVNMYAPVLDWDVPDSTVMAYRFPGLDGLELNHRVDIAASGELIAEVLTKMQVREVYLIGFSTGGPIALEAASRLDAPTVKVALISSAGPFPAAIKASVEGFFDVLGAMIRSGGKTLDETWLENYRTLLYGRGHQKNAQLAERSEELAARQRGRITTPRPKLTLAHTSSLMTWRLPRSKRLEQVDIAFFHGGTDSVFSLEDTRRFASRIPADGIRVYPNEGHLLFVTEPKLFDEIRSWFGLGAHG